MKKMLLVSVVMLNCVLMFSQTSGIVYSNDVRVRNKPSATSLYMNMPLVTNNVRHFTKIPNLILENWEEN